MHIDDTGPRRFGVMIYPDKPVDDLIREARFMESLGIDQVYLPDHTADLRDRSGYWLETLSTLAILARETSRIRIGTLVANIITRSPLMLAKQALTIDHASGGRLELGIGAGVFDWDHSAAGMAPWPRKERMERLREFTHIVDGALRASPAPFDFEGTWYSATDVRRHPGSHQRPRLPILIGGQSHGILATVARYGDIWNTIGPMGASAEEVLIATRDQNQRLDDLARAEGRDPRAIRRSYTNFGAWDPWATGDPYSAFEEMIRAFAGVGIQDFVTDCPPGREEEFARIATEVFPRLRALASAPSTREAVTA